MARLVFSGLFDRHPNMKIITHHGGGMIPFFEGRVGYGWDQLGTRTSDVDYDALLKHEEAADRLLPDAFYADTALFGAAPGTRCSLDFFGVGPRAVRVRHAVRPEPGLYVRETIRVIESLDLTADQKDKIYRKNARGTSC